MGSGGQGQTETKRDKDREGRRETRIESSNFVKRRPPRRPGRPRRAAGDPVSGVPASMCVHVCQCQRPCMSASVCQLVKFQLSIFLDIGISFEDGVSIFVTGYGK